MKLLTAVVFLFGSINAFACKMTPIAGSQKTIAAALEQIIIEQKEYAFYRVERIDAMEDVLVTLRGEDDCKQLQYQLLGQRIAR